MEASQSSEGVETPVLSKEQVKKEEVPEEKKKKLNEEETEIGKETIEEAVDEPFEAKLSARNSKQFLSIPDFSPSIEPHVKGQVRLTAFGKHIPDFYKEITFEELLKWGPSEDEDFLWVVCENIAKDEFRRLENKFGIHPLTTEDIIFTESTREKIEVFDEYFFFVLRELNFDEDEGRIRSQIISTIVFPKIVLSFHHGKINSLEEISNHVKKGRTLKKLLQKGGADWVLYALLDSITDLMENFVSSVVIECDALEELVLVFSADSQNDLLRRIGQARKITSTLRDPVWSKKEMLNSILHKDMDIVSKEIQVYLRDVWDNILRMETKLTMAKDSLNNLNQTYLARISIEVAKASDRAGNVMKKLSATGTIFLPMSFVAGLFGMNVTVPGQTGGFVWQELGWFFGIFGVMLIFMIIGFAIFKKKDWM